MIYRIQFTTLNKDIKD